MAVWDNRQREWFYKLQKKNQSEWTPEEFQECLKHYDDMIIQAYKKGRKECIKDKKELVEKMRELGIEAYPQEDSQAEPEAEEIETETWCSKKDKNKIMYIEYKGDGLEGPGRIGRVQFSKTGKTIYYNSRTLQSLKGGYKANYFDVETQEEYWISGCKKKGGDTLYPGIVEVDEDVREEYWRDIRQMPENIHLTRFRSEGKYSKRQPK